MRLNMQAIFTIRNILGLLLFASFMHSHAAVYMSKPYEVTVGPDQYLQFSVKCNDDVELLKARKLQTEGRTKWCAVDLPSLCTNRRSPLASRMCLPNFERKVAKYRKDQSDADSPVITSDVLTTAVNSAPIASKSNVSDREALLKERIDIEEKKIQLENRKIELKRMKIELEKLQ